MKRKYWKEHRLFIGSALRRYKDIGTFFPSPVRTAEKGISLLPIEKMSKIIEIGSGTGRLTQAIQNRLSQGAQLFCVEKNPEFCIYLKRIFTNSNVFVINEHFEALLTAHPEVKSPLADCVILSLPAALVPEGLRKLWVDLAYTVLKKDGYLLIQQFVPVMSQYLKSSQWIRHNRKWIAGLPPYCFEVYQKLTHTK